MRSFVAASLVLLGLSFARSSSAFCGFYVSGADAHLVNRATQVVMMRSGTRTVLAMQNAYEGPPQDFAMVVPVPVVLQKEQVKTLPRDVLDRVDQLGAPRLVEYWEQDPCADRGIGVASGVGQGFGSGHGRLGGAHSTNEPTVKIEAQFTVGEYEVVILSATDSTALDAWLRQNKYKIPDGAEPYLRPYVQSGSKFFVAKVDIEKVTMKDGRAALSPLRFHYDSDTFSLPIRLGLINSGDAQDLVVSILADKQRYEVANYPNVVIPTNLDVSEATRTSFGSFYAALFDETLRQKPGSVVTEYSWDAGTCDPCPGPSLTGQDIATLGGDVLPESTQTVTSGPPGVTLRLETPTVAGRLPPEVISRIVRQNFGRFRQCYDNGRRSNPSLQGRVKVKFVIDKTGAVSTVDTGGSDLPDKGVVSCVGAGFRGLSFPQPEGGIVTVSMPIRFAPFASRGAGGMVLTRLHMRYTKEALGEDLVFKQAPAITGGREVRGESGSLEQGAILASVNNFQARYAMRHPWTGPIACDKPVRGIWGGPPGGGTPDPTPARDLAFVKRDATLTTFLAAALPPISGPTTAADSPAPPLPTAAPSSSAAPPASSSAAPSPAPKSGCGCATAPETSPLDWAFALSLAALFGARRTTRGQTRRERRGR